MVLSFAGSLGIIFPSCLAGLAWAYFNYLEVSKINIQHKREYFHFEGTKDEKDGDG
jgi:hypothetical protein